MDTNLRPNSCDYNTSTPFPTFKKPQIVGFFSLDEHREYHDTLENLKYLCREVFSQNNGSLEFDLNREYKNYVPKPASAENERIDHLLHFIQINYECLKELNENRFINPEIICFRGLLRLIMGTPYENRDKWVIAATKYKGNIYLCAEETDEKREARQRMTDKDKLFCSYGFKFEQYLLSDHPTEKPKPETPVKEAEEFCLMYRTRLNDHSILFGAEMDGVDTRSEINSLQDLQNTRLVELKVKREEQKYYQKQNFVKFKQIKWWCQSFLVGVEDVLVGLRDDKGIVYEIQEQKVSEMPSYAKQFRDYWIPAVCMTFLSDFLSKVKETMNVMDSPLDVCLFEYDPKSMTHVKVETFQGQNPHTFLPDSYVTFVENIYKNKR